MKKSPIIIAHRGASKEAPENTIASIQRALDLGADLIECDIRMSSDLIPILFHDKILGRTTDLKLKRSISELSFQEIQQIDAGSWFHQGFKGEKIPTLDEVLKLTLNLLIEVKISHLDDFAIMNPLLTLLSRLPSSSTPKIGSFSSEFLEALKKTSCSFPLFGIADTPEMLEKHLNLKLSTLALNEKMITQKLIDFLKQHNIVLYAWTVDDPQRFKELSDMGVDGIITNHPKLFVNQDHD